MLFRSPIAMGYDTLDRTRKQLNDDLDGMLKQMESPDRQLAERSNAEFSAMNNLAREIRDYEYGWLDSLGINDVAQMRMTESKLMDARRMFRMLTHEGQSNVEMPLTFLQKGKEVVKQVGPPAVAYAVAGPEAAALTALAQKTPAVIRMLRGQPVQSPGTTTLNQALARTISEYMPYAEPAQFPAWNFGASVTKGVLPQQVHQGRVIVPPAPS